MVSGGLVGVRGRAPAGELTGADSDRAAGWNLRSSQTYHLSANCVTPRCRRTTGPAHGGVTVTAVSPRSARADGEPGEQPRAYSCCRVGGLPGERAPETTVSDVTERAGVSHGLLNHHFPDKRNPVDELPYRYLDGVAALVDGSDSTDERLAAIGGGVLRTEATTADAQRMTLSLVIRPATRPLFAARGAGDPAPENVLLRTVLEGVGLQGRRLRPHRPVSGRPCPASAVGGVRPARARHASLPGRSASGGPPAYRFPRRSGSAARPRQHSCGVQDGVGGACGRRPGCTGRVRGRRSATAGVWRRCRCAGRAWLRRWWSRP